MGSLELVISGENRKGFSELGEPVRRLRFDQTSGFIVDAEPG